MTFVDGDFPTGKACSYHCCPTCHPMQVNPDRWEYGCLHKAWPINRRGDFCPIVNCGGDTSKCEIPLKSLNNLVGGKKRTLKRLYTKIQQQENELNELMTLRVVLTQQTKKDLL